VAEPDEENITVLEDRLGNVSAHFYDPETKTEALLVWMPEFFFGRPVVSLLMSSDAPMAPEDIRDFTEAFLDTPVGRQGLSAANRRAFPWATMVSAARAAMAPEIALLRDFMLENEEGIDLVVEMSASGLLELPSWASTPREFKARWKELRIAHGYLLNEVAARKPHPARELAAETGLDPVQIRNLLEQARQREFLSRPSKGVTELLPLAFERAQQINELVRQAEQVEKSLNQREGRSDA
jgi:hypothetical protein